MMASAEGKLRAIRMLLYEPFLTYPELTERERKAVTLVTQGRSVKEIETQLGVSSKTAYRILDAAAVKISAQDGTKVTKDDLVALVYRRLCEYS
jgi:DNA-binding NarL/FixJ family response regulator